MRSIVVVIQAIKPLESYLGQNPSYILERTMTIVGVLSLAPLTEQTIRQAVQNKVLQTSLLFQVMLSVCLVLPYYFDWTFYKVLGHKALF